MSFNGRSITVFAHDYETTGVVIRDLGVVQAALCVATVNQDGSYSIIQSDVNNLNPGVSIEAEASLIHGLTDLDVMDCPAWEDFLREEMTTVNQLGLDAVVSFNGNRFDNQIAKRVGWTPMLSIDVYKYAAQLKREKTLEKANLGATYQYFFGRPLDKAHDAMADITATLDLIKPMIEHSGKDNLDEFHRMLQGDDGTVEMKLGFGKHKGKKIKFVPDDYLKWMLSDDCDMVLGVELETAIRLQLS